VLNDIALIQIVDKKPKTPSDFAVVAGGALTPVAKAHAAEVIAIIREHSGGGGGGGGGGGSSISSKGEQPATPGGGGVGGPSGSLLEVNVLPLS